MNIRTASDLGALIRERRVALGWDQQALAKQASVSRKWVVEVEAGKSTVAIGLVLRTLRVLSISLQAELPSSGKKQKSTRSAAVDVNDLIDGMKKS